MILDKATQRLAYPKHSFSRKSAAIAYLSGKHKGMKPHQADLLYDIKSVYEILQNAVMNNEQ